MIKKNVSLNLCNTVARCFNYSMLKRISELGIRLIPVTRKIVKYKYILKYNNKLLLTSVLLLFLLIKT